MRNQPPSASLLPQTYIRQKIDVQVVDLCDKALAAVEKYKFLELQHDAITPKYPDPLVSDTVWKPDQALSVSDRGSVVPAIGMTSSAAFDAPPKQLSNSSLPMAFAIPMPMGQPMSTGQPQPLSPNRMLPMCADVGKTDEDDGLQEFGEASAESGSAEDATADATAPAAAKAVDEMGPYEKARAERVAANQARLKSMGLFKEPPAEKPPKPRVKRAQPVNPNADRAVRPRLSAGDGDDGSGGEGAPPLP